MNLKFLSILTSSTFNNFSLFVHSECRESQFCLSDVVGPCFVGENKPSLSWRIFLVFAWDNLDCLSIKGDFSSFEDKVELHLWEFHIPCSEENLHSSWSCSSWFWSNSYNEIETFSLLSKYSLISFNVLSSITMKILKIMTTCYRLDVFIWNT